MSIPPRAPFALLLALVCAPALEAAARQIVIQDFREQVVVRPNSTIDVTETIEAEFIGTGWHGIYRTIPIEYTNPEGFSYKLWIDDVHATDGEGHTLRLEQSREGRYAKFKIYVPEPDDSTRTVVLRYRVLDALRFFSDHDELYWNVTGEDWVAPIESASARIELPQGASAVHAIAYTGLFGSRAQDANVAVSGSVIEVRSLRRLGYRQGLTAVVGFDKGLVHEPTAAEQFGLFLRNNWPMFFFPVSSLAIMLWLWRTRGRDPERDAITVQYEPPDKLTPGECGALVDNDVAMRDITATLVDLAVKGYLTIEQKDHTGMLGFAHHRDYIFHLKKPPEEWNDARPHERAMLTGLFFDGDPLPNPERISARGTASPGVQEYSLESGAVLSDSPAAAVAASPVVEDYSVAFQGSSPAAPRPSVALSQLQNRFYTRLPAIRDGIYNALVSDGYYLYRPDTVRAGYVGTGLVIGFLIVALGSWWAKQSGMPPLTWFVAGILSGAIICLLGWFMTARTISGARTLAKVLGFEDFLSRVESDRIRRLENAPELFEKFLPYAMALRVEKKWVEAFSGIALEPPQWYQGPAYVGAFQPYFLVNDLNLMAMQAGSTMASAPRSVGSGGSGFGGGGGAGGGFGGGGGGGF
ncbi:MAG TPA: DUF2207 domain-containing protein [Candidatus Cybelea sp.]|nr:DUF2207 domain-containing protein [Candidatus Cybelea sp.]